MRRARSSTAERLLSRVASADDLDLMRESMEFRSFWTDKGERRLRFFEMVRDRLAFLAHVAFHPLRRLAPSKRRSIDAEYLLFDTAVSAAHMADVRRYFFAESFGQQVEFVGHEGRAASPGGGLGGLMRLWPGFLGVAVSALFDPAPVRLSYLGRAMRHIMDVGPAAMAAKRVYIASTYDPTFYFAASWLKDVMGADVWILAGNTPMYRWMRPCHLRAPIVLCSRVQEPELRSLAEQGINHAGPAVYAGNEYALDLVGVSKEPSVDMGYFSSGMWARIGGLAQTRDIDGIRAGRYADNPFYAATEPIIEAMAGIARERNLRLVIYLHPFERRLMNEHGIRPPFARFADDVNIVLSTAEGSSRPHMFEPKVAVSLQSTIIWERIDAGVMSSYIYRFADPSMNGFDPDALPGFERSWLGDIDTLKRRIIEDVTAPEPCLTDDDALR
jgi:hypothetical protein